MKGASQASDGTKKEEVRAFFVLALVLVPAFAVMFVAGYGFIVWMYQMIVGPPGPPPP